jgi:hypothetical protein
MKGGKSPVGIESYEIRVFDQSMYGGRKEGMIMKTTFAAFIVMVALLWGGPALAAEDVTFGDGGTYSVNYDVGIMTVTGGSTVNFTSGGSAVSANTNGGGTINIWGGTIYCSPSNTTTGGIHANSEGTINIYGGSPGEIYASDGGTINIYGYDFFFWNGDTETGTYINNADLPKPYYAADVPNGSLICGYLKDDSRLTDVAMSVVGSGTVTLMLPTCTTEFKYGIEYDYYNPAGQNVRVLDATVNFCSGSHVDTVYVSNDSTANFNEGSNAWEARSQGTETTININEGAVVDDCHAYNSGIVNVNGGYDHRRLYAQDNGTINVYGSNFQLSQAQAVGSALAPIGFELVGEGLIVVDDLSYYGGAIHYGFLKGTLSTGEPLGDVEYGVLLNITSDGSGANITLVNVGNTPADNTPPQIDGVATDSAEPVPLGAPVGAAAIFTDPDSGDAHTATWNWGDGTTAPGTVDGLTISGNHTYPTAGVYTVTLTVTDAAGEADTAEYQYVVVYDPTAGFVTGGGWIDSRAGAYEFDPSAYGKATFGFVSKYKKGATVPTGNTEFQFTAGDLNFHSTSYDWLVVTGSEYANFKGTGTIDGLGSFKFKLWAGDSDLDTFRIKIWSEDEDGAEDVVYDNGSDQPISGGNIVVHAK